ncbi:MAG: hypothetical protein IKJ88_00940 [Clostridia bacterium]|nr:hypothetical protein [Clostridia bacterium]
MAIDREKLQQAYQQRKRLSAVSGSSGTIDRDKLQQAYSQRKRLTPKKEEEEEKKEQVVSQTVNKTAVSTVPEKNAINNAVKDAVTSGWTEKGISTKDARSILRAASGMSSDHTIDEKGNVYKNITVEDYDNAINKVSEEMQALVEEKPYADNRQPWTSLLSGELSWKKEVLKGKYLEAKDEYTKLLQQKTALEQEREQLKNQKLVQKAEKDGYADILSQLYDADYLSQGNKLSGLMTSTSDGLNFVQTNEAYSLQKKKENLMQKLTESGVNANEVYAAYKSVRNAESQEERNKAFEEFAKEHKVASSVLSVLASPVQGAASAVGALMGEDSSSPYNAVADFNETTRNTVAQELKESDNKLVATVMPTLYQAGMSAADSLITMGTFGKLGEAVMGLNSAMSTYNAAKEKGVSQAQAIASGFAAGVFEAVFEHISLGNLRAFQSNPDELVKGILKQFVAEGSEEVFTDIANEITDYLINGGLSEYELYVQNAMKDGKSRADADLEYTKEFGLQLLETGLIGGISGGMMVSTVSGVNKVSSTAQKAVGTALENYVTGQTVKKSGSVQTTLERLSEEGSEEVQKNSKQLQQKTAGKNKINLIDTYKIGKTYNQYTDSIIEDAATQRISKIEGLNDSTKTALIQGTVNVIKGKALSSKQQEAFTETKAGKDIFSEIAGYTEAEWVSDAIQKISESNSKLTVSDAEISQQRAAEETDKKIAEQEESIIEAINTDTVDSLVKSTFEAESVEGYTVQVGAVKSIIDGDFEVVQDMESGATEKLSKLNIKNEQAKELYATLQETANSQSLLNMEKEHNIPMSIKGVNAALSMYNPEANKDAKLYAMWAHDAFTAGKFGELEFSEFLDYFQKDWDGYISEEQLRQMFAVGLAETELKAGITRIGHAKLSDIQLEMLVVLNRVFKDLGMAGAAVDSLYDSDGNKLNGLLKSGDRILISLDSEFGLTSVSAGHELFHWLKQVDPEAAKRLQGIVIGIMQQNGTYEEAYKQRAEVYAGLSQDAINEEVAAQYFGVVFSSESNIRKVIENSSQQELSMWQKIVEHLKDFVKRIKDAIERYALQDKTVRAALKADADTVEELARQFDVCLKEAAKNKKPAEQVQGGEKYSYAGVKAKTTDIKAFDYAIRLEDVGKATAEEIRQQTGWFRGYDNKWRFEISDRDMEIDTTGKFSSNPDIRRYTELFEKAYVDMSATEAEIEELKALDKNLKGVSTEPKTLGELIRHDLLFSAYPQLKDMKIHFADIDVRGAYDPMLKEFIFQKKLKVDKSKLTKTLIHEIQHAIQDIEGFASGTNLDYWRDMGIPEDKVREYYENTAGEIEARDAAAREWRTDEARKEKRPDIDRTDVVFADSADKASKQMSVAKKRDAEYLELAKDTEKNAVQLRSLVEGAARDAGYTRKMFHETNAENIHIFDISRSDHAGNDNETPFGIFTKSRPDNIGLGSRQLSLYVKADKTFIVKNREEIKNKIPGLLPLYEKISEIDRKYGQLAEELEDEEFDALSEWMDEHPDAEMDKVYPNSYLIEKKPADIDSDRYHAAFKKYEENMQEWEASSRSVAVQSKEFITEFLRKNEYDSMYIEVDKGSFGRKTDSFIVLNENQVKSAELLTYADNGDIVPLSERFNPKKVDIRYSKQMSQSEARDSTDIDRMSLKDYNNRGWAYSLLNKEDIRLFNEKVFETMSPKAKTSVKKLADGTKIFDINNKILFVGGTFANPIIEFAVAINAESATEAEIIKNICFERLEYGDYTNSGLARWFKTRADYYGEKYFVCYGRKDFVAASEAEKGNIKRAALPHGFASYGYTRESYRRSGSNQNDNGEISGGVKFSKQITQQTEDNIEQLALENEALRELLDSAKDVEAELRERLDTAKKMNRTTRGLIPDKTELFRIVRKYNHSKSGYTNTELVKYIDGIMWDLRDKQGDSNTLISSLTALMQDLLETSETVNRDLYEQYADFRKYFRGSTLYVNQDVYDFLLEEYGSKKNLRNATLGKLNIKPMTETDSGTTLTQAYQDIVQHFPELLNPDVDEYHIVEEILSAWRAIQPTVTTEIDGMKTEAEVHEAAMLMAYEVQSELFNAPALVTNADRYIEKINAVKEHYKAREKELRAEKNERIRQTKERYQKSIKDARDKRNETEEKNKILKRIRKQTFSIKRMLLSPSDTKHIPEELKESMIAFVALVDDKSFVFQGERNRVQLKKVLETYARNYGANLPNSDGSIDQTTSDYSRLITSLNLDPQLKANMDELNSRLSGDKFSEITLEDMRIIENAVKNIHKIVEDSNSAFVNGKKQKFESLCESALNQLAEHGKRTPGEKLFDSTPMAWITTPWMFFKERMGGVFGQLFDDFISGQNKYALNIAAAKKTIAETKEKFSYDEWCEGGKNAHSETVVLERGQEVTFTAEQMLSIYATFEREKALGKDSSHLMNGGIVFADAYKKELKKQLKNKQKNDKQKLGEKDVSLAVDNLTSEAIPLTLSDIENITGRLTEQEKAYADALVEFLSSDMAKLGNEVAMSLYGYEKFNEKKYFPFESSGLYLSMQLGVVQTENRIKHLSFTHQLVENASNPVVLNDFSQICAQHIDLMCTYNAFTLPLDNLTRVFNYKTSEYETQTVTDENGEPEKYKRDTKYHKKGEEKTKQVKLGEKDNMRVAIRNALGANAEQYIIRFAQSANGGVQSDKAETVYQQLFSKFKKIAVLGNSSVVVQQVSSIARAFALIDVKYFIPEAFDFNDYNECMQYCGEAVIKDMGGFDTSLGKSAAHWILDAPEKTVRKKILKVTDSALSSGAETADKIVWSVIWNTVKREQAAKNPTLDTDSTEFMNECAKRFSEVINTTQVYDSVFAKTPIMNSKSFAAKTMTAFMAEPLLSLNLLMNAALQTDRKNIRYAGRAVSAFMLQVVVNNLLKNLIGALRDTDEDQTYWEKYVEGLTEDLLGSAITVNGRKIWIPVFLTSDFSVLGMIPLVKEIMSLLEGYELNRPETEVVTDIINTVQSLIPSEDADIRSARDYVEYLGVWGVVDVATMISKLCGVPLDSIIKDIKGGWHLINRFAIQKDYSDFVFDITKGTMWEAALSGTGFSGNNAQKAYRAVIQKNKETVRRMQLYDWEEAKQYIRGGYDEVTSIELAKETAMQKWNSFEKAGLMKCDERIGEAAEAKYNLQFGEYEKLLEDIVADGFDRSNVIKAINTTMDSFEEEEYKLSETKEEPDYEYADLHRAVEAEDIEAVRYVIDELISAGKKEENIKSSLTSKFKNEYLEYYVSEDTAAMESLKEMLIDADVGFKHSTFSGWVSDYRKKLRESD